MERASRLIDDVSFDLLLDLVVSPSVMSGGDRGQSSEFLA
jgi:hypothetical protein